MADDSPKLVDLIPPPEVVRARLSEAIRESELLRRMLKLAEQRERYVEAERQRQQSRPRRRREKQA